MGSMIDIRDGTESENSAGAASLVMSTTGKVTYPRTGLRKNKKASILRERRNHFLALEISSNRGYHGYQGISINFIYFTGAFHRQGSKKSLYLTF
ncbi:uncharacterized protein Bfra_002755 [Botrytis fragariae]|uniref:Uncharacterized protein n=1 Tax=Botrytis fragariae TaxID=1964551 RepID=A0A8H6AZJ2_9HELO|nr:uncharacterized protein Bfra_002755 [Botrytis fragariae]KAF5876350.1 hypothetical protein Bfra_002755 [Botrytis fragariae]